jgi:hypothetical protein
MDILLATVGAITLVSLVNKKEKFTPTYQDSEEYYKQAQDYTSQQQTNKFSPSEKSTNGIMMTGYGNPIQGNYTKAYVVDEPYLQGTQQSWVKNNSLYNTQTINGVPLKDYYEQYTKDVLENGKWFLNKDMPQETNQYLDDSQVQQRMEIYTGLRQKRDREDLGKPNKVESNNLFTPQERTTGYGYQYGNSGSGPGLAITRQKEFEDLKKTLRFKTNEQPIEKIHVGRGISVGTEVPAAGGFHQYTRVMPDNISDYSANQLPGMVAGEKWIYSNAPTSQAPVIKNRVNGYYDLCQYGPAAYGGVITAEMTRPDYSVVLKNQNRTVINYGYGAPLTKLDDYLQTN